MMPKQHLQVQINGTKKPLKNKSREIVKLEFLELHTQFETINWEQSEPRIN